MTSKNIALLVIHGIGDQAPGYSESFSNAVIKYMPRGMRDQVFVREIYYQNIVQTNQATYFDSVKSQGSFLFNWLRKFTMSAFSDAATIFHLAEQENSLYKQVMFQIWEALRDVYDVCGPDAKIVVVAHSLGAHLMSCYLWDVSHPESNTSIWKTERAQQSLPMQRGVGIRSLVSLGCNIPLFTAGYAPDQIHPFEAPHPCFEWHNVFDPDDVLGWPIEPLFKVHTPRFVLHDYRVNIRCGWSWRSLLNWTPASHVYYWDSPKVQKNIATNLQTLSEYAQFGPLRLLEARA